MRCKAHVRFLGGGEPAMASCYPTLGSMNMKNGERTGSGGRSDWPVRLSGAAGGMVGGAVGLFVVKPLIDFPPGLGLGL